MNVVVVERSFSKPVAYADVQATERRGAECLEAHRVRFLKSYVSRDMRRMVCLYEAPDAESVRLAQDKVGAPFVRAWATRIVRHAGAEPDGDAVLVERTLPEPLDETGIRDAAARIAPCLEKRGCRIVWSYLSSDGRRAVSVFAGPDAESVREAQPLSGLPCDAAWPASLHEPQQDPR
jgi:uncharacterized protein DUF4242